MFCRGVITFSSDIEIPTIALYKRRKRDWVSGGYENLSTKKVLMVNITAPAKVDDWNFDVPITVQKEETPKVSSVTIAVSGVTMRSDTKYSSIPWRINSSNFSRHYKNRKSSIILTSTWIINVSRILSFSSFDVFSNSLKALDVHRLLISELWCSKRAARKWVCLCPLK